MNYTGLPLKPRNYNLPESQLSPRPFSTKTETKKQNRVKQGNRSRSKEEDKSMASATARPTFAFRIQAFRPSSKPQSHLPIPFFQTTKPIIFSPLKHARTILSTSSIDVSKEDKPISEKPDALQATESPPTDEEKGQIDPRRLEERFAVLNTGIYECRSCGYKYDETAGDPSYPIPPGLSFEKLPEDWRCPTCGAAQTFFESKRVEIAGFAQNQQFGLGGNTLTSEQKAFLIYGSLFFAFLLFLSGYFLQ